MANNGCQLKLLAMAVKCWTEVIHIMNLFHGTNQSNSKKVAKAVFSKAYVQTDLGLRRMTTFHVQIHHSLLITHSSVNLEILEFTLFYQKYITQSHKWQWQKSNMYQWHCMEVTNCLTIILNYLKVIIYNFQGPLISKLAIVSMTAKPEFLSQFN